MSTRRRRGDITESDEGRFWSDAEAAAARQSNLPTTERQRRLDAVAELDRAFDGID